MQTTTAAAGADASARALGSASPPPGARAGSQYDSCAVSDTVLLRDPASLSPRLAAPQVPVTYTRLPVAALTVVGINTTPRA